MVRRTRYLSKMSLAEAQAAFTSALEEVGFFRAEEEEVEVRAALGRVTSRPVHARIPCPHFRSAAMDGIAVRSEDTLGARGDAPKFLPRERFEYIDTGDPLPEPYDAVVVIEQVHEVEGGVEIYEPAFPGKHVREPGEDFPKGAQVLPQGRRLRPEAIAACLSTGNPTVWVKRKPKGLFIPTGSELVPPEGDWGPGKVPETNSQLFLGYVAKWGGEAHLSPIVPDQREAIRQAVLSALREGYDFIAISAGTSKGREDFTPAIVAELGRVLVHGVGIAPGKPLLLGLIEGTPVFGLPGYPVAAWVALVQFLKPMLVRYFGCPSPPPPRVQGVLAHRIHSSLGTREFVRVRLEREGEKVLVHPLPGGSSRLSSLTGADGIVEVPEELEGFPKGAEVTVELLPR